MDDNELLYLYCIESNQLAFACLYQKYEIQTAALLQIILGKFFAVPLELNDLKSHFYFVFIESIFKFQIRKNKSFKNFFYNQLRWSTFNYFKKFVNNNHKIINCALKYNDYLGQENDFQPKPISFFDAINACNLTKSENQVLQLKQGGYTIHDIMKDLNLTYKQVDNAWTRVKIKVKKSYKKYC